MDGDDTSIHLCFVAVLAAYHFQSMIYQSQWKRLMFLILIRRHSFVRIWVLRS